MLADLPRVLFVYVPEAHATDGWHIGVAHAVPTHRSLPDRLAAARAFVRRHGVTHPVYVDAMVSRGGKSGGLSLLAAV